MCLFARDKTIKRTVCPQEKLPPQNIKLQSQPTGLLEVYIKSTVVSSSLWCQQWCGRTHRNAVNFPKACQLN